MDKNEPNVFDPCIFKMVFEAEDDSDVTLLDVEQAYDSIRWEIFNPEAQLTVYWHGENRDDNLNMFCRSSWLHCFYRPGSYETYLVGYKNNEIVYRDLLSFEVYDRNDFLMYDWNEVDASEQFSTAYQNVFDENDLLATHTGLSDGVPYVNLFFLNTLNIDEASFTLQTHTKLLNYMYYMFGMPIETDVYITKEKYEEYFSVKDPGAVPYKMWISEKSKAVLLRSLDEDGKLLNAWVHAEPI